VLPYLNSGFVAQSDGQHVSKVQTSADKPYPTCFFSALNGNLQLTVRV
jgi:ribosome-binding factor A